MVPGIYGTMPTLYAWLANNSEPYYRRGMSIALGAIMANLVCIAFSNSLIPDLIHPGSGGYPCHMELPLKTRTKVHKNYDYESYIVSRLLGYFGHITLTLFNPAPSASFLVRY